jgi:lipoate---protein ligase
MAVWRLIPFMHGSGRLQMAIDRWLFDQHCQGLQPPTLRFYTWKPVALSLGYHQKQIPEHWHQLAWHDQAIELVRRPTGGRAVLHQGDLTYAVVMSGVDKNRKVAYQQVCEFLIQGWRSLGVELQYGHAGRGYIHNPNCFGTATTADLVLSNGYKLIGSAQLRRGDIILQHGSIRLSQDAALFETVFGTKESPTPLGWSASSWAIDPLISTLTHAAENCFNADFQINPLSEHELLAI